LLPQNIVSMPDSTYDRYVLHLSLQQGRTQPMVYKSEAELMSAVMAAALCSCSLRIRFERCFSTVLGLTPSSRAITLLKFPSAMRVRLHVHAP